MSNRYDISVLVPTLNEGGDDREIHYFLLQKDGFKNLTKAVK